MTFRSNLQQIRQSRHMIARILVVGLAVVFYLALVPLALLFSGPVYRALQCQFGDCRQPGTEATFVLESRGALRIGSSVRFPNGLEIGRVVGFTPTGDERYIESTVLFAPDYAYLLDQPLRCQVTANFNLDMDADIVVSACPGLELPLPAGNPHRFLCGAVDHFERMGQEVRRFVLDNVRPGERPSPVRLTGPCGADNEAATRRLTRLLAP